MSTPMSAPKNTTPAAPDPRQVEIPTSGPAPDFAPTRAAFDLASIRLDPQTELLGAKRLTVVVPCPKPEKTEFARVHPDHRLPVGLLDLRDGGGLYLTTPAVLPAVSEVVRRVELVLAVSKRGIAFLWPVPIPDATGRPNAWVDSARAAASAAVARWVRVVSDMSAGQYLVQVASADLGAPEWPEETFAELVGIAFRGRIVDTVDHPVVLALRGVA